MRVILHHPPDESGYVTPALASTLAGLTPHDLRQLARHDDADGPPIRTRHARGRLLVHLGDALLIAGALADGRIP